MRAKEFIQLNELNMAPNNLAKFAASPAAANMMAGFEAELIFPGEYNSDSSEADYSNDSTIPFNCDMGDIKAFFEISNFDQGSTSEIQDDYDEYVNEGYATYSEENIDKWINQVESDIEEEGISDEYSRDEIRNRAFDDMQEYYYQHDAGSLYDFLRYSVGNTWSDISNKYDLTWPKYTNPDFTEVCTLLADSFKLAVGVIPSISSEYHDAPRTATAWIFEPDISITPDNDAEAFGLEVISPPMPVLEMLNKLQSTIKWAINNGGDTNDSTGLHVGVSIKGVPGSAIDYVKLALFLGDEYVLEQFRRSANTYTKSSALTIQNIAQSKASIDQLAALKKGLLTDVSRNIMSVNKDRNVSINVRPAYVEFRSMGGNYLHGEFAQIKNTILRYVQAYAVAADPQAHKEEYAKKLHKLLNPGGSDQLAPYANYVMGAIDKETLMQEVKNQRQARVAAQASATRDAARSAANVERARQRAIDTANQEDELLSQLGINPETGLRDNSNNGEF